MYNFPKDPAMRRRWMSRINRTSDNLVPNKHKVCSEHFAEEDFDPGDLLAFRMMSEKYPNSRIRLKDDAVPNTDRGTDGFVLRPETTKKKCWSRSKTTCIKEKVTLEMDLSPYIRDAVPQTFHGQPMPTKESLLGKRRSRM